MQRGTHNTPPAEPTTLPPLPLPTSLNLCQVIYTTVTTDGLTTQAIGVFCSPKPRSPLISLSRQRPQAQPRLRMPRAFLLTNNRYSPDDPPPESTLEDLSAAVPVDPPSVELPPTPTSTPSPTAGKEILQCRVVHVDFRMCENKPELTASRRSKTGFARSR